MDKVLHQKADVGRGIFAPIVEIMPELPLLILLPACKRINHEICVCPLPKGSFIQWLCFSSRGATPFCIVTWAYYGRLWKNLCSRGSVSNGSFFQESNCSLFFDCAAPWIWNGFFWKLVVVAWGTLHAIKNRWWWCYSTWYAMTVGKVQSHIWPLGYISQKNMWT